VEGIGNIVEGRCSIARRTRSTAEMGCLALRHQGFVAHSRNFSIAAYHLGMERDWSLATGGTIFSLPVFDWDLMPDVDVETPASGVA
jgi:hypothetical protein